MIVSGVDSLTYHVAKYVNKLIFPLAGETSSFIRNTQSFVDSIKNTSLQPTEVMVSFDIKLLFTTFYLIEEVNASHFLNHLNSLRPSIQFTMELEKDRSLLSWTHIGQEERMTGLTSKYMKSQHTQYNICTTLLTIFSMSKWVWPHAN